jgi:transcription-repair coupling factor (superfamily II helicase)
VFEGDPLRSPLYKDVSNGVMPGGIEYYLPLFFERTATLADYLPESAAIALVGNVANAVAHFWQDTESRFKLLRGDHARPLLPPTDIFLAPDAFNASLKAHARIEIPVEQPSADPTPEAAKVAKLPSVQVDRRADDPLAELKQYLSTGVAHVLICAESPGRRETMQQYFAEYGLSVPLVDDWRRAIAGGPSPALVVSPLASGFMWPAAKLAFVTEAELYAGVVRRGRKDARRSNVDTMLRDLSEVRIGDPVVHEEHGIGRYLGLVAMDLGEGPAEFLQLVYANDAKLYVPVANLHLIGRYSGASPDAAPLHELGSKEWEKAKKRAARQAHDTAAELLNLYAQRAARTGRAFKFNQHDYEAFAEGFPFEETPDQQAAIEAVINDLTEGKPMDRLVMRRNGGFGQASVEEQTWSKRRGGEKDFTDGRRWLKVTGRARVYVHVDSVRL